MGTLAIFRMNHMRFIFSLLFTLMLGLGCVAQADTAGTLHNIRGFLPDLRFTLQGAGGKTVTQKTLKGKVVLLYFGYSSCPDVCPTTLAQLAPVMKTLGPEAADARIVVNRVAPHRDPPNNTTAKKTKK